VSRQKQDYSESKLSRDYQCAELARFAAEVAQRGHRLAAGVQLIQRHHAAAPYFRRFQHRGRRAASVLPRGAPGQGFQRRTAWPLTRPANTLLLHLAVTGRPTSFFNLSPLPMMNCTASTMLLRKPSGGWNSGPVRW